MTSRKLANRQAAAYLHEVRRELADVPWQLRADLLATVRERLEELPDNARPHHELGPAREYASDLRESAGLAPRRRTPLALLGATRLRTKVIAMLATVMVVVLVGALVARAHYQPVTAYADFGAGTAQQLQDDLVTDVDYVRYQPDRLIVRGLQVQNHGWATVTVNGFDVGTTPAIVALREMRATTDEQLTGMWERIPRVTSVRIPPGKTAYVFMVLKLRRFQIGAGGGITFRLPAMNIHVLGVHHTVNVVGNQIGVLNR
jgi:hypothetical protein